jgi:hypothetical protein
MRLFSILLVLSTLLTTTGCAVIDWPPPNEAALRYFGEIVVEGESNQCGLCPGPLLNPQSSNYVGRGLPAYRK